MDGHAKLDRDWLAQEMRRIPADHAMSFARAPGCAHHTTLDEDSAARLRVKMIERYREWTERDLITDLLTDEGLGGSE